MALSPVVSPLPATPQGDLQGGYRTEISAAPSNTHTLATTGMGDHWREEGEVMMISTPPGRISTHRLGGQGPSYRL